MSMFYGGRELAKLANSGTPTMYGGLDLGSTAAGVTSGLAENLSKAAPVIQRASQSSGFLSKIPNIMGAASSLTKLSPFLTKLAPPLAIADAGAEGIKNMMYPEQSQAGFLKSIEGKNPIYQTFKGMTNPITLGSTVNGLVQGGADTTVENIGNDKLTAVHKTLNNPALGPLLGAFRMPSNAGLALSNHVDKSQVSNAINYTKGLMNAPAPIKAPPVPVTPKPPTIQPKALPANKLFATPQGTPPPKPVGTPAPQFGKQAPVVKLQ